MKKNVELKYLTDDEYNEWDEFVENSPQGNIFNKSYWLKAVSKEFKILVYKENGKISGGITLPSMYGKLYKNPKLTPQLGVLLPRYNEKTKYSTGLSKDTNIMGSLIENFPKFNQFDYNFSYNFNNLLPFIWEGYNVNVKYTYVIENLSDIDSVYNNFQYDTKYSIKKALNSEITVVSDRSIEDFYKINKMTFERQKIEIPYTLEFLIDLDKVLTEHGNRKIFFALDKDNKIIAGVYLLYDKDCTYYLMGGADPEYRDTGVQSLLIWESIKFASLVSSKFDFEGSMVKSIERYFRDFGGTQKVIYNVYKSNPLTEFVYKVARKNKNLIRKVFKV